MPLYVVLGVVLTLSGDCYDMFMVDAPKCCKNASAHFIKLYIHCDFLTAVSLSPVRYVAAWQISSVEEFGLRDGDRFFLKACTLTGKGRLPFIASITTNRYSL